MDTVYTTTGIGQGKSMLTRTYAIQALQIGYMLLN